MSSDSSQQTRFSRSNSFKSFMDYVLDPSNLTAEDTSENFVLGRKRTISNVDSDNLVSSKSYHDTYEDCDECASVISGRGHLFEQEYCVSHNSPSSHYKLPFIGTDEFLFGNFSSEEFFAVEDWEKGDLLKSTSEYRSYGK